MPRPHAATADSSPCEDCTHARLCARDGHECRAFIAWIGAAVNPGPWKAEDRRRPLSNGQAKPATTSLHFVAQNSAAVCASAPTNPPHVAEHEIATEHHDENPERAEPRCDASTIESAPVGVGVEEPIAPLAPLYESQSPRSDEHSDDVPRGTIVTPSDELPTFEQSRVQHAREYLTRVLMATHGERARAAMIAGVSRTTMQGLIRRFGIDVPMNPKARGRNWRRSG